MHCQSVAVPGGRVNFYEVGAGPPVVLLHGLLGSPAYLAALGRSLAASGRRVLIPALPGHAGSPPLEPFTFERAADHLAAAMSAAGAERPALMGHSLGATLAVHWAARHPLRGLVAASPVGMLELDVAVAKALLPAAPVAAAAARLAAPLLAGSATGRRLVFGWFVGMAGPQLVRPALGQRMIRDAAAAWPALEGVMPELGRTDLADVAGGADCPSLVVWGELDAHAGNGDALAAALGGERLALAGVGHMPMLEVPFSFRRALDGWL
ncbi:MAG TPA: alpha/beta hydrolase [Gaiellales bacterium]|nr:alpha/beta hydrolase [Gaiellales bacterium]